MFFFAIRRTIGAFLILIVMSIVTFLLFFATPIDPRRLTCGKNCTPPRSETNRHSSAWTSRSASSGASS